MFINFMHNYDDMVDLECQTLMSLPSYKLRIAQDEQDRIFVIYQVPIEPVKSTVTIKIVRQFDFPLG